LLFNSLAFLVFFPTFLVAYLLTRGATRLWLTLLASYFFYAWWDWRLLPLLWFQTGLDFTAGYWLHRLESPVLRKRLLIASLSTNLCLLGFFKYANFGIRTFEALGDAIGVSLPPVRLDIVLPVGISFYTFQSMSYVIDVYRREVTPEKSLLRFATSIALFLHLVAGPIVRARKLLPQLQSDRCFDAELASAGFEQLLWGFFKKVAVADSLAAFVDAHFADPMLFDGMSLLVATLFYAFQIYGDFSGYTDIALGGAKILGYDLGVNFDRPYFAASFSSFWTRWHISLSSWLRDYLYIPLGGNRHGTLATYRNLMLTMLLGGLWHGASWTFVAWGALHGLYLVVERALRVRPSMLVVFPATCFAWIFFRAETFGDAADVIHGIVLRNSWSLAQVQNQVVAAKGFLLIAVLVAVEAASFRPALVARFRSAPSLRYGAAAAVLWAIALFGTYSGANFIYFQF
jgi:D-alanyl-lipoteichoic acid acyltransferase DltB (MBOAT superfamily)